MDGCWRQELGYITVYLVSQPRVTYDAFSPRTVQDCCARVHDKPGGKKKMGEVKHIGHGAIAFGEQPN